MSPIRVKNVRPWGGESADLLLEEGRIVDLRPAAGGSTVSADVETIDGRGLLALPGYVNAHAHVDKTWWGMPWVRYGGAQSTEGRIAHEREVRDRYGIPSAAAAAELLREMVAHGTTAMRSHVDVDLGVGNRGVERVLEALEDTGHAIDTEIVAFAQDGVLRRPGVDRLLVEAARMERVSHIGAVDPAGIDRDPVRLIDLLVEIAAAEDVGIDLHLHDGGELGAFQIELLAERTIDAGLQGRVTVSHGFALGELDGARRETLVETIREAGIAWATAAPAGTAPLPWREMLSGGIELGIGTDGVRDLWNPFGDGDMMRMAQGFAKLHRLRADDDLETVVRLVTVLGARLLGREQHDLVIGGDADIVLVDAENPVDVLTRVPLPEIVIAGGRVEVFAE